MFFIGCIYLLVLIVVCKPMNTNLLYLGPVFCDTIIIVIPIRVSAHCEIGHKPVVVNVNWSRMINISLSQTKHSTIDPWLCILWIWSDSKECLYQCQLVHITGKYSDESNNTLPRICAIRQSKLVYVYVMFQKCILLWCGFNLQVVEAQIWLL